MIFPGQIKVIPIRHSFPDQPGQIFGATDNLNPNREIQANSKQQLRII